MAKSLMPQMLENLKFCRSLTKKNRPVVIVVDGGLGQGKTTLAVWLADDLNGGALPFDECMGMGGEKFIQTYDDYKQKHQCLIYDEAGDFAKRGAMTKFNKDLGRIFETFRAFKVIVVIVLPRFWWLDTKIYELGVVQMLIHCYGRNEKYGRYAVWFPDTMSWLIARAEKLKKLGLPVQLCYGQVSPNQRGLFYDLPAERSAALTKFGIKGKSLISEQAVLKSQSLISVRDLCKSLGRSYPWVLQKLKSHHCRVEKVYKNKNYYSMSVLDLLRGDL